MTGHLVIGGNGLIGTALCMELSNRVGAEYLSTTRRETDSATRLVFRLGEDEPGNLPDAKIVYLVAAMPGFAGCEGNAMSWVVNVDAQIEIARCYRHSAFVVYVSSDSVEWCGGTAYARQKAQVESYISAIDGAIVRPTRVLPKTVGSVARLLVDVGLSRKPGVYRWKP